MSHDESEMSKAVARAFSRDPRGGVPPAPRSLEPRPVPVMLEV